MAGQSAAIKVNILGDPSGLGGALSAASGMLSSFSSRMEAIGSQMRIVGSHMTLGLTLPIVGALGLGVKWAGELEDARAATDEVFGAMAGTMDRWASNSAQNFGLAKGEALEWSNQVGIRLRNISGMSEQEAALTAQSLTQLGGDLASFYGGTVPEAMEALNSALTGEFEPMKRYGVVINDAALKAEFFALTGQNVTGTLTAQQKQQATLSLLMKQTAVQQGDYARNADGATNAQRTMTAELKNAATTLGTILLPYVTRAVEFVTDLVDRFQNLSPTMQKVILVVGMVVAALGPIIYIAGAVATAIGFIATPVGLVVAAIAALIAGLVYLYTTNDGFREWVDNLVTEIRERLAAAFEWFKENVLPKLIDAFNWVKDVGIPAVVDAFHWFQENVVPVLNDLGSLIAAWFGRIYDVVSRWIEMMMPIWSAVWDAFVAVVEFVWPIIKGIVEAALNIIGWIIRFVTAIINGDWSAAWQMIVNVAKGAWDWIVGVVQGGIDWVLNILRTAAAFIGAALDGAWQYMANAAQLGIAVVVGWVQGIGTRIQEAVSGAGLWLLSAGGAIVSGLLTGIQTAWVSVTSWVAEKVAGLVDLVKNVFGISSPSKVFAEIGGNVVAGLVRGLDDWKPADAAFAKLGDITSAAAGGPTRGPAMAAGGTTYVTVNYAPTVGDPYHDAAIIAHLIKEHVRVNGPLDRVSTAA